MDAGKISGHHAKAHGPRASARPASPEKGPQESVELGAMARVDQLIADLRAGKIAYAPEIAANVRPHELTEKDWPCQKFVIHAGKEPLSAADLPTEIVPKKDEPRYKHSVTVQSQLTEGENEKDLKARVKDIHHLADELYAQHGESLLVMAEGDNADGKDGLIKHVFQLNPQTTSGTRAFKAAKGEEKQHEPNWRIMRDLPGAGQFGFHNRTAYGDVVFAAKTEADKEQRLADIKEMEYGLTMGLPMTPEGHIALPDAQGQVDPSAIQRPPMRVLKVLLNTSKPEQAARLAARLLDEKKLYKESQADIDGHEAHVQVQTDFAQAMAADSTPWAPTYLLPNDNKPTGWRKMAQITDKLLHEMNPHRPGYQGDLTPEARKAAAEPLLAEVQKALHKHHS